MTPQSAAGKSSLGQPSGGVWMHPATSSPVTSRLCDGSTGTTPAHAQYARRDLGMPFMKSKGCLERKVRQRTGVDASKHSSSFGLGFAGQTLQAAVADKPLSYVVIGLQKSVFSFTMS